GVSREAATHLAKEMGDISNRTVMAIRENLKRMDDAVWIKALGKSKGVIYHKVWKILEGVE
ncbi:MAG TPA: hypothetical protein VK186_01610, partial [Candidatus Deferrimicrobium sp.]|nr:hypothetical protein [Candidatus Deferrimicrobium sp.]